MAEQVIPSRFVAGAALALSVVCMSAGGTFFALMGSVPPFLKASWRLWVTSAMQLIPFCMSVHTLLKQRERQKAVAKWGTQESKGDMDVIEMWARHLPLLILTGVVLAVHFMSWSWSVSHTSLTHSLLLVCSHPVLIVFVAWFVFAVERIFSPCGSCAALLSRFKIVRPGFLETLGALVAMVGAVFMVGLISGGESNGGDGDAQQPTVAGDLAALLGAAMMAVYLAVGSKVRQWMPIWMYAFPVTFSSAVVCSIVAMLAESSAIQGHKEDGVFGWFDSTRFAVLTIVAAGVSGILGHTLANYSLKQVSSLIVSISILGEALIGSIIGWLFGLNDNPDLFTWIGGFILLVGGVITIYGQGKDSSKDSLSDKPLVHSPSIPIQNDFIVELYGSEN